MTLIFLILHRKLIQERLRSMDRVILSKNAIGHFSLQVIVSELSAAEKSDFPHRDQWRSEKKLNRVYHDLALLFHLTSKDHRTVFPKTGSFGHIGSWTFGLHPLGSMEMKEEVFLLSISIDSYGEVPKVQVPICRKLSVSEKNIWRHI